MKKVIIGVSSLTVLFAAFLFHLTQPIFAVNPLSSDASVKPERLAQHVKMLSETLAPRDAQHPANLNRAADYIRQDFIRARGQVSDQRFMADGVEYRNIIATFGPDTQERIVVGAHYDTAGAMPGADDNASGVAGLIELAHLLGKTTLPIRIDLVAYTLEEPPHFRTAQMGSAVHALSLKRAGVNVRAMLSLEMIGYFSDAEGSQTYPINLLKAVYPSKGNFITVVGHFAEPGLVRKVKRALAEATPLPVYSINAPRFIPGIDFSDHLNYWNEGFPAVMITDTSSFRNLNYHTQNDTADKLDFRRMALTVEGVFAAVKRLMQ